MAQGIEIFETMIKQLGGVAALTAMIGARKFVYDEKGGHFRFAAGNAKVGNCFMIELTPADTYNIKFYYMQAMRSHDVRVIEEFDGVYVDQLVETFETHTGLRLSL